jgi:hypothetical protein
LTDTTEFTLFPRGESGLLIDTCLFDDRPGGWRRAKVCGTPGIGKAVPQGLALSIVSIYGTAEQAAEKLGLVSGHGFSRAAQVYKYEGF